MLKAIQSIYFKLSLIVIIILSAISCITPNEFLLDSEVNKVKRNLPNLDGFITIKADMHLHTVFSDGKVTYKDRINEAYHEDLDIIVITDHNQHRFFPNRIPLIRKRKQLWESAQEYAKEKNIILIKGTELTRLPPIGHFCAIFLDDITKFNHVGIMGNLREAKAQNAFVFWNHLYQYKHNSDGTYWRPKQTKMLEEGLIHGIELNGRSRDEAFSLCLEKNMTVIGTSDGHSPQVYKDGNHRRMTLIFARERTPEAIYEALMERRTVYYGSHNIYGEEKYLREIFEKALKINFRRSGNTVNFTFSNSSDLIFNISIKETGEDAKDSFTVNPQGQTGFNADINNIKDGQIVFYINNFFIGPGKVMEYSVRL